MTAKKSTSTLYSSGEDYLEAIRILIVKNGTTRSSEVAEYMGVTRPSVCRAVRVLTEGGYLVMDGEFCLHLTKKGQEIADKTYEKHCFFKQMLINAGVDSVKAEQEACEMEHSISEDSFEKLRQAKIELTGKRQGGV